MRKESELVGDEAITYDLTVILGSEQGLWDEVGYSREPSKRVVDREYSVKCVNLARDLCNQETPWLVHLVLALKHGIRKIDDASLLEIGQIVNGVWPQEGKWNETFDCRLETLRIAISIVLHDRGLQ